MSGLIGILIVWPLTCLMVGGPLIWLGNKFVTRDEWERMTTPSKYDERPPPKWHGFARGACTVAAFLVAWLSLPFAMALTAGR